MGGGADVMTGGATGVSIDALYRHEGLKLRRFLNRLLDNPADAADASQETYLRMVAALSRTSIEHGRVRQ